MKRCVGRHQIDGHRRTEIDDQHVAARIKHRGADRRGQPVAAQRFGRQVGVADGYGRLRRELQQILHARPEQIGHFVHFAARRSHDGPAHGPCREQLFEHRRMQPLHAALKNDLPPVENSEFHKGVSDIYY